MRHTLHDDLRLAFSDAADLMFDALERHLESPLEADLIARVIAVARQRRDALRRYEDRAGLRMDRGGHPPRLEDLLARAEVDGAVEAMP